VAYLERQNHPEWWERFPDRIGNESIRNMTDMRVEDVDWALR